MPTKDDKPARSLPIVPKETVHLITTRWGAPLRTELPNAALLALMVDEVTFVAKKDRQYGLLFEYEFLHTDGEDDAGRVRETWGARIANPTETAVADHVASSFAFLRERFPGIDAWVTVGSHVFNHRVALRVFVPEASMYATPDQCAAIGQAIEEMRGNTSDSADA